MKGKIFLHKIKFISVCLIYNKQKISWVLLWSKYWCFKSGTQYLLKRTMKCLFRSFYKKSRKFSPTAFLSARTANYCYSFKYTFCCLYIQESLKKVKKHAYKWLHSRTEHELQTLEKWKKYYQIYKGPTINPLSTSHK